MKIKRVELTNVKCYEKAEFDFENGINFISGMNGAGKTSIIESIGFALFGYKVGKTNFTNYFIRRGEKKAAVRIIFEDKSKEEYIVERKISATSNNSWVIKDIQSEEEIVSGDADVINWLKDHLGFHREEHIDEIYENIISVPQGMFTSAFMDTPQNRKNKFDPIFNLEIYRRVFNNTANLDTSLKDKKNKAEAEAGKLEVKIEMLTKSQEEYTGIKQKLDEIQNEKTKKDKEYAEIDKSYQEKNSIKEEISRINEAIKIDKVKNESINERIDSLKKDLEVANNAKKVLEDNKQGYENYLQEEKEQRKLRTKKNQYDLLISGKKELEANIESCKKIINIKNETKKESQENIKTVKDELKNIKEKIEEEEKQLGDRLIILEQEKREIDEVKEKENALDDGKALIDNNNMIIQNNATNVKKLEKKVSVEHELLEQKQKIEKQIENKEKIEKEKTEIEESLSKLSAQLEYVKESKQIAKDGICPYLKSECINVKGKTQEEYNAEIEDIEAKMKEIQKAKKEVTQYEKNIIKAETELKSIIDKLQEILENKQEIENLNKDTAEKENNIKKAENEIKKILKENNIEELNDLQVAIKDFKKFSSQRQKSFSEKDKEYNIFKTNLENRKREKEKQEKSLDKSKEQLIKLENEISDENEKIQKYSLQINQREEELEEYSGIEKQIEENEKKLQEAKPLYDIYMQNIEVANRTNEIEKKIDDSSKEIEEIRKKLDESYQKLEELNKKYNEEEFKKLEQERNKLMLEVTEINIQLKNSKERLKLLENEVEELKQAKQQLKEYKDKLETYSKVIEYLGKIRKIIKQVPEDISEVLIQKVSRKATEIYTKIANDNTRLEWREGYEVILTDSINGKIIEKEFRQLSGGEQMSAALAIRISMLEILTSLKIGILDEPTVNMDIGRRQRLAEIIENIGSSFVQLFIVSHDDTFNSVTENTIQLDTK